MSNSIWKTPKESPRQEQLVAWVDRKGMHAGRFDTCYACFCACAEYFVDLKKVKKWCSLENLEDLIAQADKAERLQKAADLLIDSLKRIQNKCRKAKMTEINYGKIDGIEAVATETIKEIKQQIKE